MKSQKKLFTIADIPIDLDGMLVFCQNTESNQGQPQTAPKIIHSVLT